MPPPKVPNASRGTANGTAGQGLVNFAIRAVPLPRLLLDFILDNVAVLKQLQRGKTVGEADEETESGAVLADDIARKPTVSPEQFWDAWEAKCKEAGGEWVGIADRTWAFGPQQAGGCILVDARKGVSPKS